MASYSVLTKGFYNGIMYSHDHPHRNVLHADKKFAKCPSWLKEVKPETATEKKKRLSNEAAVAKAAAISGKQDKADIASVTFVEPLGTDIEVL